MDHDRRTTPVKIQKLCIYCEKPYLGFASSKCCSDACRGAQTARRKGGYKERLRLEREAGKAARVAHRQAGLAAREALKAERRTSKREPALQLPAIPLIRRDHVSTLGLFSELRALDLPMELLRMNGPCVYFLLAGDRIVYVGQTNLLAQRLAQHLNGGSSNGKRTEPKSFEDVVYLPMPDKKVAMQVEYAFIKFIRPILNGEFEGYESEHLVPLNKQLSNTDLTLLTAFI